ILLCEKVKHLYIVIQNSDCIPILHGGQEAQTNEFSLQNLGNELFPRILRN
ncbi:Hypothetical predicted protein, partial [Podarcis lilfordi]